MIAKGGLDKAGREFFLPDDIRARARGYFVVEQLAQCLGGEVPVLHVPQPGHELVREHGNVRALKPAAFENVDDLGRDDRSIDELADGKIRGRHTRFAPFRAQLADSGLDGNEETGLDGMLTGLIGARGQLEGLRERGDAVLIALDRRTVVRDLERMKLMAGGRSRRRSFVVPVIAPA